MGSAGQPRSYGCHPPPPPSTGPRDLGTKASIPFRCHFLGGSLLPDNPGTVGNEGVTPLRAIPCSFLCRDKVILPTLIPY